MNEPSISKEKSAALAVRRDGTSFRFGMLKVILLRSHLKNTLSLPNVLIGSPEFWMPA